MANKSFALIPPAALAIFMPANAIIGPVLVLDAAALIADYGIVESAAVAEKALPRCNIVCLTGQEMFEKLSGYLQVLAEENPESVGGRLPEDRFYYGV